MELAELLKKWGWKTNNRARSASKPYTRLLTLGPKEPWFHAKLKPVVPNTKWSDVSWECVISWRTPGRDCLLLSFHEKSPIDAAQRANKALLKFEAQARLGWVP